MYAPTLPVSSGVLAVLACEQNVELRYFDIEQVFIQSECDEDVFTKLPRGCGSCLV